MILVDTNVLLDVVQDDPVWADWSQARLEDAALAGRLMINDIIYTELSIAFERIEELETVVAAADLKLEHLPREALFLAGKAFLAYRKASGNRQQVLPDFFIGAHAAVRGWSILTRDSRRYRSYFPGVRLIAPTLRP